MIDNLFARLFKPRDGYTSVVPQQGRVQTDPDLNRTNPLFGIYRAIVVNTVDPQSLMRIQVKLSGGLKSDAPIFAQPCLPPTNTPVTLPPSGATVWIAFENGDQNLPIWMGNLYALIP